MAFTDNRAEPRTEAPLVPGRTLAEAEADARSHHFLQAVKPLPDGPQPARFNALADRIAEDTALLVAFEPVLSRVVAGDAIRAGAAAGLAGLPPSAVDAAARSKAGNVALFVRLCRRARERAALYRRWLERDVVRAPEHEAVFAERRLLALEQALAVRCPVAARAAAVGHSPSGPLLIRKR